MNGTVKTRIKHLRAALAIIPPALSKESMHLSGHIRARKLPFDNEQEWRHWWLVQRNESGQIIGSSRMSEREKERYTVAEGHNILVSSGITNVLNYIGSNTGQVFAQQFAVGNISLAQVESNDTIVAGEYFRAAPSTSNISGVQLDLSTLAGNSSANGTITNVGLFGAGATSTINSGTLMTHSLFNFVKTSSDSISFDYLISYI